MLPTYVIGFVAAVVVLFVRSQKEGSVLNEKLPHFYMMFLLKNVV